MTSSSSSAFPGDSPSRPQGTAPADDVVSALANRGWQALITIGLASIALGAVVLAWPGETLRVLGIAFGVYLLVSGVLQLVAAFGTHVPGHLRAMHVVAGALSILLGLICFRGTLQSILLLALWIGFGWLMSGIMMTAAAGSAPQTPARGWQLFLGIVTLLAGIVLIVSPFGSIAVLAMVAGIMAVVLGAVEVFHAVQLRIAAGRHAKGTPTTRHRRSLFHAHPHPQH
ncbi:HdeD family acid-resistance protein [Streptomyces sp. RS10V-4]|uniref:HdeD family acid-resistance protein n=1 Tax=Streptomyces rhizoryzae TaxID=2932493 RepID=UPI0020062EC7|nr:HdeD family acid-resistance protein [Streptomyces rhizoryzae]MCK7622216.1 HdeD family acid-resistance protein [Streptomyces rhizoryzae]